MFKVKVESVKVVHNVLQFEQFKVLQFKSVCFESLIFLKCEPVKL